VVIRVRAEQWPPAGSPELPGGLWTATAILAVLSGLLILAVRSARASKAAETSRLLAASTALGVAFLAAQTANWVRLAAEGDEVQKTMLAFVFWTLTVLHALHVLGGLIPLSITTVRAAKGRYLDDPEPIELVGNYWHFLAITWIAIFLVLVL
jgi:cytochrome c oxidase subunit 3